MVCTTKTVRCICLLIGGLGLYGCASNGSTAPTTKGGKEGVISKEQSEQTRTNADAVEQAVSADRAAIESAKAEIVATQATVENYKVQLGYTEIRSPIDGRTGNIMAKQGNVVNANTMDLMTINQVEPI